MIFTILVIVLVYITDLGSPEEYEVNRRRRLTRSFNEENTRITKIRNLKSLSIRQKGSKKNCGIEQNERGSKVCGMRIQYRWDRTMLVKNKRINRNKIGILFSLEVEICYVIYAIVSHVILF